MKLPALLDPKFWKMTPENDEEGIDMSDVASKIRCKACNRKGFVMKTGTLEIKKPCRSPSCGMLSMGLPIVVRKPNGQQASNIIQPIKGHKTKNQFFPRTTGTVLNFDEINKTIKHELVSDVDWSKDHSYLTGYSGGRYMPYGYMGGDW